MGSPARPGRPTQLWRRATAGRHRRGLTATVADGSRVRRSRLAAGLLTIALASAPVAAVTPPAAARTAPVSGGHVATPISEVTSGLPVQVYIDQLTPRVVRPHTQVLVTGRLVNAQSTSIGDVRVRLRSRDRAVVSRSELTADATRQDALGLPVDATTTPVTRELAPG